MPFTKGPSDESSPLREMAYGWGKVVSRRAYGDQGPPLDLDYESIESMAVEVGQAVIRGTIQEALKKQLQLLGELQPCPQCARNCAVKTKSRSIQGRGGTIHYDEPVCHCPACRRDFFPSPPDLEARLTQLLARDPW